MEQDIKHSARRPAPQGIAIAVKRVFADIEIERRQIHRGKGKHRLKHALKIKPRIAVAHNLIQFCQPVQHQPLQLWHVSRINPVAFRKITQRAQHVPHGVAQPAIAVRDPFEDLIPDPLIGGVIGLRHP